MLKKLFTKGLEQVTTINSIKIKNPEVLDQVKEMNTNGEHVIFASNHIKPSSEVKQNMAFAEDYPVLQKVLREHGITKVGPVMRGDMDMVIGDSRLKRLQYDVHRKIFSLFMKKGLGAETVHLNKHEKELRKELNVTSKEELNQAVFDKNIAMFPFGNWFESGEQDFEEDISLPGGTFFRSSDQPHEEANPDIRAKAMHEGLFELSDQAQARIIPTYLEVEDGHWHIRFGEPILPPVDDEDRVVVAKEWLEAMRGLKNEEEEAQERQHPSNKKTHSRS